MSLVHPNHIIEPYEQTLNTARARERLAWAHYVYGQMKEAGLLKRRTTFLWLAGQKYKTDLSRMLSQFKQIDPLQGKAIGERLSWLNQALGAR